jgi:hypothetical protein
VYCHSTFSAFASWSYVGKLSNAANTTVFGLSATLLVNKSKLTKYIAYWLYSCYCLTEGRMLVIFWVAINRHISQFARLVVNFLTIGQSGQYLGNWLIVFLFAIKENMANWQIV